MHLSQIGSSQWLHNGGIPSLSIQEKAKRGGNLKRNEVMKIAFFFTGHDGSFEKPLDEDKQ